MDVVGKFFERIGLSPDTKIEKTLEFLNLVQYSCVTNICYENLDILDRKPLSMNFDDIYRKIVVNGRGGYCFEVNGLLSYMLMEMGFEVTEHFARFLRGESEIPMRRHRVCVVKCGNEKYMCDIGIGQSAPKYPVCLKEGEIQKQFGEEYKFEYNQELGWILKDFHKQAWRDFISFTPEKQYPVDFVQPTFYCENHPDSIFIKNIMMSIKTKDGRKTLDGRCFKVFEGDSIKTIEENVSDKRLNELMSTVFKNSYRF